MSHSPALTVIAQQEIDDVVGRLPRHIREAAQSVALRLEDYPDEEGLDDDLLGLFTGNTRTEMDGPYADALPTEIVLFLENIWDYAEENEETFREEVRITYLHELGHFLGLDEIDLEVRGLD